MHALSFTNLLFASAAIFLAATPTLAAEPTVSISGSVVSGRIFGDQGFTLTTEPVTELDFTVCKDGTCFNLWTTQSLVGRSEDHETDIIVWHDFKFEGFTLQLKGGYYEIPGKDVWNATVTGTVPLSTSCAFEVSYEIDEGGFTERAWKLKSPCSIPLQGGWTFNVAPAIAHSEAFPGTTGGLELDFTRTFDDVT